MTKISVDKAFLKSRFHLRKGEIEKARLLYESVLKAFPNNKRAKLELAQLNQNNITANQAPTTSVTNHLMALYQKGQLVEVVEQASQLTQEFPHTFMIWNILGAAAAQIGKTTLAENALRQVISLTPDNSQAYNNLAITLNNQGKYDEAEAASKKALTLKPDHAEAYNNLAVALHNQGKLDEAIAACQQALSFRPNYPEAYNSIANAFINQGKYDEAVAAYKQAITLKPDDAVAYNNLAVALHNQGKLDEVIAAYRQAICLKPDYADAYNNMAIVLSQKGQYDEAITAYKQALTLKPDDAEAYNNLAVAFQQQGKFDQEIEAYKQAISLKPDDAGTYNDMAIALHNQCQYDEAITAYEEAITLKPNYAEAYNNLANVFNDQGKFDEALTTYKEALDLRPDYDQAKINLSHVMLKKGELKEGFDLMEYRMQNKNPYNTSPIDVPTYQGQNLLGRHLLIYGEQGVGDEVMFASILNDLNNQGALITLVCNARLVDLFNRSFEFLTAMSSYKSSETPADYWVLIGSLAKFYRNDISKFENNLPSYLNADDNLIKKWEKRFNELEFPLNIGISWRGGSKAHIKKQRSLNLEQLTPILSIATKSANIINLQYGEHKDEIEAFEKRTNIIIHDWQDADPLKDLDNFSAQIKALDLVISIATATVHFAGGLGVKTLVMLPFESGWNWALERDDSYWYPKTIQLFRQQNSGDWIPVIKKVSDHLAQVLNTVATTDG